MNFNAIAAQRIRNSYRHKNAPSRSKSASCCGVRPSSSSAVSADVAEGAFRVDGAILSQSSCSPLSSKKMKVEQQTINRSPSPTTEASSQILAGRERRQQGGDTFPFSFLFVFQVSKRNTQRWTRTTTTRLVSAVREARGLERGRGPALC